MTNPPKHNETSPSLWEGARGRALKQKPKQLVKNAKALRRNQTDAENLVWMILRNKQFHNLKFRRQHPIKKYIIDFYCHEKKIAIELDGGQHNEEHSRKYDKKRTNFLESQGIHVFRFWNNEVLNNPEGFWEFLENELNLS